LSAPPGGLVRTLKKNALRTAIEFDDSKIEVKVEWISQSEQAG